MRAPARSSRVGALPQTLEAIMATLIGESSYEKEYCVHRDSHLMIRVRGEYQEMPGLRLTVEQAMRLWALDRRTCTLVLRGLVETGFLRRDSEGQFVRDQAGI
jgi:hypothetical protein